MENFNKNRIENQGKNESLQTGDTDKTPKVPDMEIELLGMLLLKEGGAIPQVASILNADDFFHKEHQIIYKNILALRGRGIVPNILSLIEEMRGNVDSRGFSDLDKAGLNIVLSIGDNAYTNAYAEPYAQKIKEKSLMRQLAIFGKNLADKASDTTTDFQALVADTENFLKSFESTVEPPKIINQHNFFNNEFENLVKENKLYVSRRTGFSNIDEQQIFSPGLYVMGGTPATGKTTFCWQLLHQLARRGETCIFCSYEMSRLELYSKTLAREVFLAAKNKNAMPTAADIRRGACPEDLKSIIDLAQSEDFPAVNIFELRDENIDELLRILKPRCKAKGKAPVVVIDYLQIIPAADDRRLITDKAKIDDIVHKLKTFQRETNTTFIVISSFNRSNYCQQASFESFKESGNIEYSADVVWALQLNVVNTLNLTGDKSPIREKIEEAKRLQPREIEMRCLKNRQGNNYDCYFHYFSAHDYFKPCDKDFCESSTTDAEQISDADFIVDDSDSDADNEGF